MRRAIQLCLLAAAGCALASDVGMTALDRSRLAFLLMEQTLWSQVQDPRWKEVTNASEDGPDVEIAKTFSPYCEELERSFPRHRVEEPQHESWLWASTSSELLKVDELYETFRRFVLQQTRSRVPAPHADWVNLAETVLNDSLISVPAAMQRVDRLVVHGDLFRNTNKDADERLCSLQQSPQQLLYTMYNTIALTELKGYIMIQYSYMLLKVYGKGNFSSEGEYQRERFEQRSQELLVAVKIAMSEASREIWRCDPQHHEEGKTFVALTRLLQGYIENEVDMNPEQTCRENCGYYSYAKNYGCFKDMHCARQKQCKGKILNCKYVDSDMSICPADRNSDRRYEWIEYENSRVLGQKGLCNRGTTKVDSWWRGLLHCSYCMCICDESGDDSDRYFSLWPVLANTSANKVITGVRFTKQNRVIHMQIAEGTLLPLGKIDQASVRWKDVKNLDVYRATKGIDYHEVTYEARAVDLDDLDDLTGQLLTGVRFRMVGGHINLEMMTTPFNFTTGKLTEPKLKSFWHSNDNTDASSKPRKRLNLYKPNVPTRSPASRPDSEHDQFIEFTHSDLDSDAAQTTVPYLDAQEVQPLVKVPLTGVGLYHKGRYLFGGFIAPKVFTYDYTRHMSFETPGEPMLDIVPLH